MSILHIYIYITYIYIDITYIYITYIYIYSPENLRWAKTKNGFHVSAPMLKFISGLNYIIYYIHYI